MGDFTVSCLGKWEGAVSDRTFDRIMTAIFFVMGVLGFVALVEGGKSLARLLLAIAEGS